MSNYSTDELVALIRRFGMERERYVKYLAREARMGLTEFTALDILQEAGELTPNQLSERLLLTSGATTALIDRLEALELLTRSPNPEDRRSWLLRLTRKSGDTGAKQLAPYLKDLHVAASRHSASERSAIGRFLEEAAAAAAKHACMRKGGQARSRPPKVTNVQP